MAGTVSDWIIAMEKAGIRKATALHSKKLEDYQRLKESGLPIFEDLILPFNKFSRENRDLEAFLSKYEGFVIRAIPSTKDLPRRYKIGVRSFEECQKFLSRVIKEENQGKYSVFLSEYEPQTMAGIIISRNNDVLIEVAKGNLDILAHGQVTPVGGHLARCGNDHFRRMRYSTTGRSQRELMWNALQLLKTNQRQEDFIPDLDFMKGYFEFVVTEKGGKIKFLDYKVNPAYLV